MASVNIDDAEIVKIRMQEISSPSNPASGYTYFFFKLINSIAQAHFRRSDGSEVVLMTESDNYNVLTILGW